MIYTYFTVYNHTPFTVFLSVERSTRKKTDTKHHRFFHTFKPAQEYALKCADDNSQQLLANLAELEKTKMAIASKNEASLMKRLSKMEDFEKQMIGKKVIL